MQVVTFKIEPQLLEKLDEYAKRRRLSRSEILRDAIKLFLATEGALEALELESENSQPDPVAKARKLIQCPFCPAKLPSLQAFRFHIKSHLAEFNGTCPVCGSNVKKYLVYHAATRLLKSRLPLEQRLKYAAIVLGVKSNGAVSDLKRSAKKLALSLIMRHCLV